MLILYQHSSPRTVNSIMLPRPILPGTTYMVSRRVTQRQFLLRPSRSTNQIFRYCLAHAASISGVQLHAVCVMSNHYHIICTDVRGLLPKFVGELNKLVTKCINASYGRWENVWAASTQTSYVRLADADAMLRESAYALANPTDPRGYRLRNLNTLVWGKRECWRIPPSAVVARGMIFNGVGNFPAPTR